MSGAARAAGLATALLLVVASGAADPAPGTGTETLATVPAKLPGAPPFPEALRLELGHSLAALGPAYEPRTAQRTATGAPRYTNRLLLESSPYLRQHAHNPVDWHPWGPAAFDEARALGKLVFLSIGYSTCHWCHVMEEESFDDPAVAEQLNRSFVAIKLDREMRPDVDAIYMRALHAMGQSGGWPLNVWLTPDRRPFFGGTYFPPEDRFGRRGFRNVLTAIETSWKTDPERLARSARALAGAVQEALAARPGESSAAFTNAPLLRAASEYTERVDRVHGGIGRRTKFPSTVPVRWLLRHARRSGNTDARDVALLTLEKMAAGGIHDQLGGGFHRYSTDPRWRVPHFEKMLYDNALLVDAYLEGWLATRDPALLRVVRRTLDYLEREMSHPGGGFYSATDADSATPEGSREEGRFFTWTPDEIARVLGADAAELVGAWYGVTTEGSYEGRNVLYTPTPLPEFARVRGRDPAELAAELRAASERLLEARSLRPPPLRDEKLLAAWNGLAISAFARAGFALGDAALVDRARRAAAFVIDELRSGERLARVWLDGRAAGPSFLEDHAFVIAGLLDLFEASSEPRWLEAALSLQRVLDQRYAAPGGGYFRTADDAEELIARELPTEDAALPSGNSVAALNLLRLYALTGDPGWRERAGALLSALWAELALRPTLRAELLLALELELDRVKEVVIVTPAAADAAPLLDTLRASYLPSRVFTLVEGEPAPELVSLVPGVAHKRALGGRPTAYVCENRVCDRPTSEPAELARQLATIHPY